MKSRSIEISRILVLGSCLFASACAPIHDQRLARHAPLEPSPQTGTSHEPVDFIDSIESYSSGDECVSVEAEQFRKQELAELGKLGKWQQIPQLSEPVLPAKQGKSDFPLTVNKQVNFYLKQFQKNQRIYFARSLARSGRYLPMIRQELKKAGLPQDLLYLAFVESGFRPTAYSKAGAMGLWQFMRPTGRKYGLQIDPWVDERRDPQKATQAAVRYLADLYDRFESWPLAVAGYNAGEGKIANAIKKYQSRDFWKIANNKYLKLETKSYVPKLIAASIIGRNPEMYGFSNIKHERPLEYDELIVPSRVSLSAIAKVCNISTGVLKEFNPELRTNYTPANQGDYLIRLPIGMRDVVAGKIPSLRPVEEIGFLTHVVRKGETLTQICNRYNISKISLLKANNLHAARLIAGKRLRIPSDRSGILLQAKGKKRYPSVATVDGSPFIHTIQSGETLSEIGAKYHVSTRNIMEWNDLQKSRSIRTGRKLVLYRNQNSVSGVGAKLVMLKASSDRKGRRARKNIPVSSGNNQSTYTVKQGDSLWNIARQFGVSTNDIKRWNSLSSVRLHPGMTLAIKAIGQERGSGYSSHAKKQYYHVRNGDSIWTISRKFRVSARDIRHWNNLKSNLIHPGKRLIIKGV